ncbi:WD repeat-containing protein 46 [Halotydeus destructor]|nr:WD repeat-containing protein 46 [Halotydeus destructor]
MKTDSKFATMRRKERQAKQRREKEYRETKDQFPGDAPVDAQKFRKYKRAPDVNPTEATKLRRSQKRLEADKVKNTNAVLQSARAEVLLTESAGYLEPEANEETYQITQKEIQSAVDITSATKHFDLEMEHGPYQFDYFRNGRYMVLGGAKGHVASFDWVTKDLQCEFNVQESVHAVKYLHMPSMYAVAQKDYVHIYDTQGIELHCLKPLFRVKHLDFLPYHFLLVAGADTGYITWLDVSMGKVVSSFRMPHAGGDFTCMAQNKWNAIMHTGHANGTVALWSPNEKEPLVKMLAQACPVKGLTITDDGKYMATTGLDRSMKIWDLRTYKCLYDYKLHSIANGLSFSQKNLLAAAVGPVIEVYRDPTTTPLDAPYMRHKVTDNITDLSFCNFEDVIGIGHGSGFTSVLVPGAAEPNFDAFEANPFMSSSQRKEMEVKMLLEKIQPELITLDTAKLATVDKVQLKDKLEAKAKVRYVKNPEIEMTSNTKIRQKTAKKFKIKRALKEVSKKEQVRQLKKQKSVQSKPVHVPQQRGSALDRFKGKS